MLKQMLLKFEINVNHHLTKKNSRSIFRSKSGRMFPGKSNKLIQAETLLITAIKEQLLKQKQIKVPITMPVHIKFTFYLEKYLTKKQVRSRSIPDLSNLYELPQDCLQKAGVLENDCLIFSHDGSRRLPSKKNKLVIEIYEYKESEVSYE